jgi:hypothetical protein
MLEVRAPGRTVAPVDERAARAQLRRQIAALENQLSDAVISSFPHGGVQTAVPASRGPRVLTLGELEAVRDALATRLAEARAMLDERGEREEASRALLERMLLEPGRYKFVRVANRDLGEGGCGVWQVRPRLGLIGMLMGWWQVKLSSGCPLAS